MTGDSSEPQTGPPFEGAFSDRGLIVVVDDNMPVLEATRALLANWGYGVVTASSVTAAVDRLARSGRCPDLLICDASTGDAAAAAMIDGIRELLRVPIPALIVSADTFPERLRQLHASGHHVLHKPIAPASLRATLEKLIKPGPTRKAIAVSVTEARFAAAGETPQESGNLSACTRRPS